jgi:hypothetical protein
MALTQLPAPPGKSNVTKQQFLDAVLAAKEYILVRCNMRQQTSNSYSTWVEYVAATQKVGKWVVEAARSNAWTS